MILTPEMLDAIKREIEQMPNPSHVREIRLSQSYGSPATVTLDGGYGTYSFIVNRKGKTWSAGLGIGAALT